MRALIVALCLMPLAEAGVFAQYGRNTGPTDAITAIRDVSDKAQDFWNAARQQRGTIATDLHMNMGAFAGQALALNDVASYGDQRGYRNDNDLRNGARRLVNLAMEIDRDLTARGTVTDSWRMVQQNLLRLSDIYQLGYNAPGLGRRQWRTSGQQGGYQQGQQGGIFRWRGRVDGSDHILLRGSQVTIKHLQYSPIRDASYDLPQPLPARNLNLRLNKVRGRGRIEIVSQPASWNNYTATILVEDPDGGDDYYEFELTW